MKQVGTTGDYRKGTYTIEGADKTKRLVPKCTKGGTIQLSGTEPHVTQMHVELDPRKTRRELDLLREEINEFEMKEKENSWLCEYSNRVLKRVIEQSFVGREDEEVAREQYEGDSKYKGRIR